jgi:signal transduction histidine kinase
MLIPVALIIAILLQVIAAIIALNLIRITKGRLSWILISVSFLLMSIRRIIEFLPYVHEESWPGIAQLDNWLGFIISVLIITGVILIGDVFYSLKKAEKIRFESERKVLNAIIDTEEKDKERFAKDLHDELGTLLSTISVYLSMLKSENTEPAEKDNILGFTKGLVNEAIQNTKEIAYNLMPESISRIGLTGTIKAHCERINKTGLVTVHFNHHTDIKNLKGDVEVTLFRIVKELINNTLKHAKADTISINLKKEKNLVVLEFNDNGRGFNVKSTLSKNLHKGLGLSNIVSRIKALNGTFKIDSKKGYGTSVIIKVRYE